MRLLIAIMLLVVFALPAMAQYTFQITTERDADGYCINWQDITVDVSYDEVDGIKVIHADIPDGVAIDDDDLQEKYVGAPTQDHYLVSFSFIGVGLEIPRGVKYVQYWFRYSKDGVLFSESCVTAVMKPGKPANK